MFEGQRASQLLQSAVSMEAGDGDPCGSIATRVIDVLETTKAPENGHVGILRKGGGIDNPTEVHLHQCPQHGHPEEKELEATVHQESCDIIANTETCGMTQRNGLLQWMGITFHHLPAALANWEVPADWK